jgi:hypothetical protein
MKCCLFISVWFGLFIIQHALHNSEVMIIQHALNNSGNAACLHNSDKNACYWLLRENVLSRHMSFKTKLIVCILLQGVSNVWLCLPHCGQHRGSDARSENYRVPWQRCSVWVGLGCFEWVGQTADCFWLSQRILWIKILWNNDTTSCPKMNFWELFTSWKEDTS